MAKTVNLLKVYRKELIETLNKNDFEAFKVHCKKWSKYLLPLPNAKLWKCHFIRRCTMNMRFIRN